VWASAMHKFVSFNLQILPAEKVFIRAISSAALYGKGIFTTLAIYNTKPFLWEKHWRRLQENSAKLNIDLTDFDEDIAKIALSQIILQNNLETGRARLTFFDESANGIWNLESQNKTGFLITTADLRESKTEIRLTVSPFPVNSKSPLANVKSCNYLENLLAFDEAKKRGFDEAIRLNEKSEIASASMANIFWVKDEKIFTPSLETGCLAGTTRSFLLENFSIGGKITNFAEINLADEIFLTSAGIGLKSVRKIDEKLFGNEITAKMQRFFVEKTDSF
jgi:branched-subunit amino acid aminotransferase/4-amino-4-deoxychorismate lyase